MNSPREIRAARLARRFMPRLWKFAFPVKRRGYETARRLAFRAWCLAFKVRVKVFDV